MTTTASEPLETEFGTFYPRDHVVAIVADDATAERALMALRAAGWTDDEIQRHSGQALRAWHATVTRRQGLVERIGAALGSDEIVAEDQYLEEAAKGRALLTIAATTAERARLAAATLTPFSAYAMRHYSELTVTDLLPDEAAPASRPPRTTRAP